MGTGYNSEEPGLKYAKCIGVRGRRPSAPGIGVGEGGEKGAICQRDERVSLRASSLSRSSSSMA